MMTDEIEEGSTEFWRMVRKEKQERHAANRAKALTKLTDNKVPYKVSNAGAHLIVGNDRYTIDFWPGTGRWIDRRGAKGFDIKTLLKHIKMKYGSRDV